MILFLTGPPRAGKTLRAVEYMVTNYYKWDENLLRYVYKKKSFVHYSNIEGLNIEHIDLIKYMKDNRLTVGDMFTDKWAEEQKKKHKIILFTIDECHRLFPQDFFMDKKSNLVKEYLAYHGHYNHHYLMLTQSTELLWKPLPAFCELELKTVRQSLRPPGFFIYNVYPPKSFIKIRTEVKSKKKMMKYMPLYKTAQVDQTEKVKKFGLYKILIVIALIFPLSLWYIKSAWTDLGDKNISNNQSGEQVQEKPINKTNHIPGKKTLYSENDNYKDEKTIKHITKIVTEETKYVYELSYCTFTNGDKLDLQIVHPLRGCLVPIDQFEYPIRVYSSGKRTILTTMLPEHIYYKVLDESAAADSSRTSPGSQPGAFLTGYAGG